MPSSSAMGVGLCVRQKLSEPPPEEEPLALAPELDACIDNPASAEDALGSAPNSADRPASKPTRWKEGRIGRLAPAARSRSRRAWLHFAAIPEAGSAKPTWSVFATSLSDWLRAFCHTSAMRLEPSSHLDPR